MNNMIGISAKLKVVRTSSLGVDQIPVAMRGLLGLLCFFTRTTPRGSL